MFIRKQKKVIFYLTCLLFLSTSFSSVYAQILQPETYRDLNQGVLDSSNTAGYATSGGTNQIGTIVATVIKAFLGLLGIIFIYLLVLAGYNWMTAAGDEQKVTKAKDEIKRAVIGLIIVISAYAITSFVFKAMSDVASPTSTGYGDYY